MSSARLQRLYDLREQVTAAIAAELDNPTTSPPGRPPKPITLTCEQLREAHRRHAAGDTDTDVLEGERQYQRAHKRAARKRKDVA